MTADSVVRNSVAVADPQSPANVLKPLADGSINVNSKPAGALSYNTNAATAGFQIKTGAGVATGISVNTAGTGTTATLYDGTDTSGVKLGTFATTSQGSVTLPGGFAFTTGLFVVLTAGSGAADVTISYF